MLCYEVERICVFAASDSEDCRVAVRFQTLVAATGAVDALDGRFFAERALRAQFDDGTFTAQLPGGEVLASFNALHASSYLHTPHPSPHPKHAGHGAAAAVRLRRDRRGVPGVDPHAAARGG
jgi:hypothetical protein